MRALILSFSFSAMDSLRGAGTAAPAAAAVVATSDALSATAAWVPLKIVVAHAMHVGVRNHLFPNNASTQSMVHTWPVLTRAAPMLPLVARERTRAAETRMIAACHRPRRECPAYVHRAQAVLIPRTM